MREGESFQHFFLDYVLGIIRQEYSSQSAFVRAMWDDSTAARQKWTRLVGDKSGENRQPLTLSDCYDIARTLNTDLPSLVFRAHEKWKEHGQPDRRSSDRSAVA